MDRQKKVLDLKVGRYHGANTKHKEIAWLKKEKSSSEKLGYKGFKM